MRGGLALALLLVTAAPLAGGGAGPSPRDLEALLDRPISPGVIALLVDRGGDPRAVEAVAKGLNDPRPEIRAMAARFAGIRKAASLGAVLRETLRAETDLNAAREQVRALGSLGAGAADEDLLEAARRMGGEMSGIVAETLVRHHRIQGLRTYLDHLRAMAPSRDLLDRLIATATRSDPEARRELAGRFLAASDATGWKSLWADGLRDEPIEKESILSALRHADGDIRDATVWMLVERFSGTKRADAADWLAAMDAGARSGDGHEDVEAVFGRALLGRILGRPGDTDEAWVRLTETADAIRLDHNGASAGPYSYMTAAEFKALRKRQKKRFGWEIPRTSDPPRPPRVPPPSGDPVIRVITDYPRGLVPDLIRLTGCVAPSRRPEIVEADATYGADGGLVKVRMLSRPTSDACLDLAVGLLSASIPPPGHVAKPESVERLLLFVEDDWLEALDERWIEDSPQYLRGQSDDGREITPPKRIRFVKPDYPMDARNSKAEGKVIMEIVVSTRGIVRDMKVLKVTNLDFYRGTLWAVSQWRYEPAKIAGRPVPVFLTVIVEFNLE